MLNFLHTYTPSPILVSFGSISIHWYGFLMTLAMIAGFFVARTLWVKTFAVARRGRTCATPTDGVNSIDHFYNLSFYLIIFSLLSARLYHVLNELPYYWGHPTQVLSIWNGGLALHGAILGGIITIIVYTAKHDLHVNYKKQITNNKQYSIINTQNEKPLNIANWKLFGIWNLRFDFLKISDIFVPALALGQAVGRWGNYFNQELYGVPTNLPWGIPIEMANRVTGFETATHFHPTFLYESILNLVVFTILIWLYKRLLASSNWQLAKKLEASSPAPAGGQEKLEAFSPGTITAIYLILYSIIRMSMEFIRIDTTPIILGIRLPILVSGIIIIGAVWFLVKQKRLAK